MCEADEHRAVVGDGPVGHVPPEDVAEALLVRAPDVRVVRPVIELHAVELRASDHAFLLLDRQRLPGGGVVLPLLQEQDRAAGPGRAFGDEGDPRRVDQRGVLGPVDEAGQIQVVPVGPARGLLGDRRPNSERGDRLARRVEDDVVRAPRQPQDGVVLRGRHHEAVDADEVLVEPLDVRQGVVGRHLPPQLGPEPGHQVDAAHRGPRLAQRRDRVDEIPTRLPRKRVELQVRVGRRAEREDPALRCAHVGTVPRVAPAAHTSAFSSSANWTPRVACLTQERDPGARGAGLGVGSELEPVEQGGPT